MIKLATKDQEREALAEIKKIVEGLGPESYIGTAFDGCFQDAVENIDNDSWFSMKQRFESEHEKAVHNEGVATEACKALNTEKQVSAQLREQIDAIDETLQQTRASAETLNHLLTEQRDATGETQRRADAAEQLVTELKAKLYDYMTGAVSLKEGQQK